MTDEELFEELLNPTIIGVTLWYRSTPKGEYEYNHFEIPKPNLFVDVGVQKSWKNQKWKYTLAKLNTKTHKIFEEGELI